MSTSQVGKLVHMKTDRQTDRQREREGERERERETDRQTDRETDRQTGHAHIAHSQTASSTMTCNRISWARRQWRSL